MKSSCFLRWLTKFFSLTFLVVLVSCGSFQAVASPSLSADAGPKVIFMPENELHLEDYASFSNVSRAAFHQIINSMERIYSPIVSRLGARLSIIGRWDDSTVNAYAYQRGGTWYVEIFGGLARRPEITPDGLSLVVCHELGHHLGGFPSYSGQWASSEGQSDYFTTQACAKKIWADDRRETERVYRYASEEARKFCSESRLRRDQQPACVRSIEAATGLARLLGRGEPVSVYTPDPTRVQRTSTSHPDGQCRLDTYAQGAICIVGWRDGVIPRTEAETEKYTCTRVRGFEDGNRPRCWYKPQRQNSECFVPE